MIENSDGEHVRISHEEEVYQKAHNATEVAKNILRKSFGLSDNQTINIEEIEKNDEYSDIFKITLSYDRNKYPSEVPIKSFGERINPLMEMASRIAASQTVRVEKILEFDLSNPARFKIKNK